MAQTKLQLVVGEEQDELRKAALGKVLERWAEAIASGQKSITKTYLLDGVTLAGQPVRTWNTILRWAATPWGKEMWRNFIASVRVSSQEVAAERFRNTLIGLFDMADDSSLKPADRISATRTIVRVAEMFGLFSEATREASDRRMIALVLTDFEKTVGYRPAMPPQDEDAIEGEFSEIT